MATPVSGRVVQVGVTPSQDVKQNTPLMHIENSKLPAKYCQSEAGLGVAEAELRAPRSDMVEAADFWSIGDNVDCDVRRGPHSPPHSSFAIVPFSGRPIPS
jgi:hypothetical protein